MTISQISFPAPSVTGSPAVFILCDTNVLLSPFSQMKKQLKSCLLKEFHGKEEFCLLPCCQNIINKLLGVEADISLMVSPQFPIFIFSYRLTAKAVAVLLPILGSSWIFGILAVNAHALVFQYIFAVFNSLQVSTWWENLWLQKCFWDQIKWIISDVFTCLCLLHFILCSFLCLLSLCWPYSAGNCLSLFEQSLYPTPQCFQ